MYDIDRTICEIINEENYVIENLGEYYLRACYNLVPINHEIYDTIVIELTEHNCMYLLDVFFEKHMLYFCNEILLNDKYTYL